MDELSSDEHSFDQCGHSFHKSCIIDWLRRGNLSCPNCRRDVQIHDAIPSMAIRERSRYLMRQSRRKNAPLHLKQLVREVQDTREKRKVLRAEFRIFKKENAGVIRRYVLLRRKEFRISREEWSKLYNVGLFESREMLLPRLQVGYTPEFY